MMSANRFKQYGRASSRQRGAALLVCLFVIFLVTLLVVNVLDAETLELSSLRNSIDYERALALANAAAHHAVAELEAVATWRGAVSSGSFPADDTYTATAVDGADNTVVVTAKGAAGSITRTVTVVVEL